MNEADFDTLVSRIRETFEGVGSARRTPSGIARETGLPVGLVTNVLEKNPELFRQSPISPGGMPLYALQESESGKSAR